MLSMELVSSRKSDYRGKACQEGKPREEIIASSKQEEIHIFDLNIKFLGV
jgi:hypothetical protein